MGMAHAGMGTACMGMGWGWGKHAWRWDGDGDVSSSPCQSLMAMTKLQSLNLTIATKLINYVRV